jgi:CrcB protein
MVAVMPGSLSVRRRLLAVCSGGFCGTITRYEVSAFIAGWLGKGWPYDLLLINVTGALLLAFVITLADGTFLVGPTRRLFINVGFLGAYTTFSSFALNGDLLLKSSAWLPAFLYIALSIIGGVLAILLGDWLGLWFISKTRRSAVPSRVTRKLTETLNTAVSQAQASTDYLDGQDDLLLPDGSQEHESMQREEDELSGIREQA